jgi:hypothetical protein
VSQERDILTIDELRCSLLGARAVGLAFLRAINTTQADTFGAVVVQDFDGVAIEDGDDEAGEVSNGSGGGEQEQERTESKDTYSSQPYEWKRNNKTPVR